MFQTIQDNVRALGWWNGLVYLLATSLSRITSGRARVIKYELMVQPVSTEPLLPPHRGRQIHIYEAALNDRLLKDVPGRREAVAEERFAHGARCLVAELDGELVGFLWFIKGDYPEDEVRCLFRPEPSQECASGITMSLWREAQAVAVFPQAMAGCERVVPFGRRAYSCSRISGFNPASRGSHARLGAKKVGSAVFLVLGKWQFMFATRRPFVHASFSERRRPVLRVQAPETD
jgi:hypothetical protein